MVTTITREDILNAMEHFDREYPNTNDYDSWLNKAIYTRAVRHNGRIYPCKWLVADVLQVETSSLNTNADVIPVLVNLGFEVIPKTVPSEQTSTRVTPTEKPSPPAVPQTNPPSDLPTPPGDPPLWLRTVRLVLEIMAISLTVIGGILALIRRSK